MSLLLIAEKDADTRRQVAELFNESQYEVVAPDSVVGVLRDILKKDARVVLLGSEFDGMPASDLIPLLKQCNRNLTIILMSSEESLGILRKLRKQGIFYHALMPVSPDDKEELLTAVQCAFENPPDRPLQRKEVVMKTARTILSTLVLVLLAVSPAMAVDTTRTYHSGWLVLLFIGLFALIVVAQMVPAMIMLLGVVKGAAAATKKASEEKAMATEKVAK